MPMRLPIWSRLVDRWRPFEGVAPVKTVPIDYELRNGVTLEAAKVYRNGVVVESINTHPDLRTGPVALPANIERVSLRGFAARQVNRERLHRSRVHGLVFDAPLLQLRSEKGRRFRRGGLTGGSDGEAFQAENTFRIPAARLGARFTMIRCAGEQVTVRIPRG